MQGGCCRCLQLGALAFKTINKWAVPLGHTVFVLKTSRAKGHTRAQRAAGGAGGPAAGGWAAGGRGARAWAASN